MTLELMVPAQNLDAERAVLGCILLAPGNLADVAAKIEAGDFYLTAHRLVWEAMLAVDARNHPIDFLTVRDELVRRGQLEQAGGVTLLSALTDVVPALANALHYAGVVVEASKLRRLHRLGMELLEASAGRLTASEVLERADAVLLGLAEEGTATSLTPVRDLMDEVQAHVTAMTREGRAFGLRTGYFELDGILGGLRPGEFIILAGRPSMGKSCLALNIARNLNHAGQQVAFFAIEVSRQQVAQNVLCMEAQVDTLLLRRGKLSAEDRAELTRRYETIKAEVAQLWLYDASAPTCLELRSWARRAVVRHAAALIVVDYLQLIQAPRADNRQEQVAEISRSLKALAKELKTPILAISQLNRQVEDREGHIPRLADLRESGAIEQDADVVLLLHRPEFYKTGDQPGIARLEVAKQRNGPTGIVNLVFRREVLRFENARVRPDEEAEIPF